VDRRFIGGRGCRLDEDCRAAQAAPGRPARPALTRSVRACRPKGATACAWWSMPRPRRGLRRPSSSLDGATAGRGVAQLIGRGDLGDVRGRCFRPNVPVTQRHRVQTLPATKHASEGSWLELSPDVPGHESDVAGPAASEDQAREGHHGQRPRPRGPGRSREGPAEAVLWKARRALAVARSVLFMTWLVSHAQSE
jgi:hypothetical protein